jgi:hypothetical protein
MSSSFGVMPLSWIFPSSQASPWVRPGTTTTSAARAIHEATAVRQATSSPSK